MKPVNWLFYWALMEIHIPRPGENCEYLAVKLAVAAAERAWARELEDLGSISFFGQAVFTCLVIREFGSPLVLVFVIIEFWFIFKGNKALLWGALMYFKDWTTKKNPTFFSRWKFILSLTHSSPVFPNPCYSKMYCHLHESFGSQSPCNGVGWLINLGR